MSTHSLISIRDIQNRKDGKSTKYLLKDRLFVELCTRTHKIWEFEKTNK